MLNRVTCHFGLAERTWIAGLWAVALIGSVWAPCAWASDDDADRVGAEGTVQTEPPEKEKEEDLLGGDQEDLLGRQDQVEDDLLGGQEEDLLSGGKPEQKKEMSEEETKQAAADAHEQVVAEDGPYPSASACQTCHPDHFREWSVSAHAYAQMSPVFNAMHGKILKLTNGTNGDFCIRCHTPVGMNIGEPLFMSNMDRHPTSREGITCIVCHRLDRPFGKLSGRLYIVQGDLFEPVYGPTGNKELKRVLSDSDYKVNTTRGAAGRAIHTDAKKLDQISESGFCGICHDVTLLNGFRLEEAFSEYKTSPAVKHGETCQDCHMGREPGVASGYDEMPAAVVGTVPTRPRKHTNHMFAGPDYSIIHPGIFPHNRDAQEMASIREWLTFDYKAGWGTDAFEDTFPDDYEFPDRWKSIDDRYAARVIIEKNLALLKEIADQRKRILQVGYVPGEITIDRADDDGLAFTVEVKNGTDGHAVPTGFDAERVVYLQVTVTDAEGTVIMKSGDTDPNGDLRDLHSIYVHNGELPLDEQLFSLQSRFLTRNVRGGEREQVLAINYSVDVLPFIRPSTFSAVLTGRPGGARKHKQGIAPGDSRRPHYTVSKDALTGKGPYKAKIAMKAGMVPVNLIDEIKDVGFDYFMSPREVADAVRYGHITLWERELAFDVDGHGAVLQGQSVEEDAHASQNRAGIRGSVHR